MPDFKLVESQQYNTKITKDFSIDIEIARDGLYVIVIGARALAWWQNIPHFFKRYFQDDHLSVRLNTLGDELAWNGNDLKGLEQTNIFLSHIHPGSYRISFKVKQQPTLLSLVIYEVVNTTNPNLIEVIPSSVEDGNRRPVIKVVAADVLIQNITIDATVLTGRQHMVFFRDDDDLKAVINGEVVKNDLPKSHTDWYWCGQGQRYQQINRRTLEKKLSGETKNTMELYADRTPAIHRFELILSVNTLPPRFDELYIIDDDTFTHGGFTQKEIQDFFEQKSQNHPNHLAFRIFHEKSAAQLIYQAAKTNSINPKVMVTKLQAEQGVISGSRATNPTQSQLDRAMGVGILDDGTVLGSYQGFENQVAGAAQLLRKHFDQAEKEHFTLRDVDGRMLLVKNSATYSLYRYTPHVAGAKLFFDIYSSFFRL
ncbi:hypothetical protein HY409_02435 [Candidatus Gottesmanbacteria bacterium]|nr:hypothetical protein [Candidatus Gottesmanbacteria bacterium]